LKILKVEAGWVQKPNTAISKERPARGSGSNQRNPFWEEDVCFLRKRHPAPRGKPQMKSLGIYAPPLT